MKTRKQNTTTTKPATTPTLTQPTATKDIKRPVTTIEAQIDVGFGNNLFVRGQGAGLSWDHGLPLTCVDGKTWRWSGAASDDMTFKLLLNDSVWAQGENLQVKPGQQVQLTPSF